MKKKLLVFIMVMALALAIPMTANAANVAASIKGNDVTITVTDEGGAFTQNVTYVKNTTQTYEVGGYTVQVQYNGSGVSKVTIVSAPAPASATNAPDPKIGYDVAGDIMTWNAYDALEVKAYFVQSTAKDKTPPSTALVPVPSKKLDASGDKIPSNAHSGDFPGIYFYWNDQQKEDGILKVDPALFDLFKDGKFYITAKNSNAYWDYWILPDEGIVTAGGYLLYQIPRYFMYLEANNKNGKTSEVKEELKNINMIFIGGEYKDAYLIIDKEWFDEEGNQIVDEARIKELNESLSFNNGLKLGQNKIAITDFNSAYFGKKLTVTEGAIPGYKAKQNPISVTVKWDDDPIKEIKFENQKQYGKIKIEKKWDVLDPKAPKPEVKFNIFDAEGNLVYENVGLGIYDVKEGLYTVKEIAIPGFTPDKESVTVTLAAGENMTVTFTNKEDRAKVTVTKNWDFNDLPLAQQNELKALLEFETDFAYRLNGTVEVKAGAPLNIKEIEKAWSFNADTDTHFVNYTVQWDKTVYSETAVTDMSYEFTFTNTVVKTVTEKAPAKVKVVKNWDFKDIPAEQKAILEGLLKFDANFTFDLGIEKEVAIGTVLNIKEIPIVWEWSNDTATHYVKYTVTSDAKVYSEKAVSGESYVFTFNNTVVKTETPKPPAKVKVVKNWDFKDLPAGQIAILEGLLKFDANFDFVLGQEKEVAIGTALNIKEIPIVWEWSNDTATHYVKYTVTSDTKVYSETAVSGESYVFTFANTVVKTETPKPPAKVKVVKNWDFKDLPAGQIAILEGLLKFDANFDFVLGQEKEVAIGTALNIKEIPIVWEWSNDTATHYVKYTITSDAKVYSETAVSGESYVFTFANTVVKTETPKPAKVTIVKNWLDENGQPLSKTGIFATVDADIAFSAFKLGTTEDVVDFGATYTITENLSACEYADDGYLYTFKQDSVTGNVFTVAPGGNYTVTFTNKLVKTPRDATLFIEKIWTGAPLPDGVAATLTDGYVFGSQTVKGDFKVSFKENALNSLIIDGYIYTFDFVSVQIDDGPVSDINDVSFITKAGGDHKVVIVNKVIIEAQPAEITIKKDWVDIFGEVISPPNLKVAFTNGYELGFNKVAANTEVDLSELPVSLGGYFIAPVSVVVYDEIEIAKEVICEVKKGEAIDFSDLHVLFTAEAGGRYTVTFTNELDKKPTSTDIYDKIPSKTHVDRWWNDFGVLAYGASSNNDKDEYLIAFSEDFWEANSSATIGFGTQGSYEYIVEITLVDGHLVFTDKYGTAFNFYEEYTWETLRYDNHYTSPKEKNHPFAISYGVLFQNPYGSGAKQMWLLSIVKKSEPEPLAAASAEMLLEFDLELMTPEALISPQEPQDEVTEEEVAAEEEIIVEEEAVEEAVVEVEEEVAVEEAVTVEVPVELE